MKAKQPMLASAIELDDVVYPVLASPKFDGIRAVVHDTILSRRWKPIPNTNIQEMYRPYLEQMKGWDGEMVVGSNFHESTSVIMSESVEVPRNFRYYVFDVMTKGSYIDRFIPLLKSKPVIPHVQYVSSVLIFNQDQLLKYEEQCVNEGYEGIMLRRGDRQDKYKFGRSTTKERYLLKFKRFNDEEALVINFDELMSNQNEATEDSFGHKERSSKLEGLVPMGTLGSLVVVNAKFGEFRIGSGFNAEQRKEIWKNKDLYRGRFVKYRYQPAGSKYKPRFPVFLGLRAEEDM